LSPNVKPDDLEFLLRTAISLLRHSKHSVALTGAGISTPSGIPDFRSPHSGLWERYDPMEVASLTAFRHNPGKFYDWIHPLAARIRDAEPNAAHTALARLENAGYLDGIITQNIDALHHRAGSNHVLELHGHLREATCVACYTKYETEGMLEAFIQNGDIPRCTKCGGVLKPNAVLFGEQLPFEVAQSAEKLLSKSDLILIAGSSLQVTPAAMLPIEPLNQGAKLIIVNHTPTYLDERADVVFHEDVITILPHLADGVLGEEKEEENE
jgi:NAD-dependent deacetylase